MPVEGRFVSRSVPEDMADLRIVELKAIGRVTVPRNLDRRHPGLVQLLKREDAIREKVAKDRWYWRSPSFESRSVNASCGY